MDSQEKYFHCVSTEKAHEAYITKMFGIGVEP